MRIRNVKEFIIDRSQWLPWEAQRGGSALRLTGSYGKTADGRTRMCCLGIYLNKCGVPKDTLNGYVMPRELPLKIVAKIPSWLSDDDDTAGDLANVNDTANFAIRKGERRIDAREKKIKALFKKQGVKVKFIGKLFPKKPK